MRPSGDVGSRGGFAYTFPLTLLNSQSLLYLLWYLVKITFLCYLLVELKYVHIIVSSIRVANAKISSP